ncbi:hypothetical protein JCM17961_39920 [Endothiovibrio diazotrophicus]
MNSADLEEALAEKTAVMEIDGGLTRAEAEAQAPASLCIPTPLTATAPNPTSAQDSPTKKAGAAHRSPAYREALATLRGRGYRVTDPTSLPPECPPRRV